MLLRVDIVVVAIYKSVYVKELSICDRVTLCACRLSVCVGVVCSCPGWSWIGSWISPHESPTWICLPTVWLLCPLWCPGASSTCKLSIFLTTCWRSCLLLTALRRSSAPGTHGRRYCGLAAALMYIFPLCPRVAASQCLPSWIWLISSS